MPKTTHERKHDHGHQDSQKGFISNRIISAMNKNEKIIMGVLVGGIIIFLILSIVVLFGKGGRLSNTEKNIPSVSVTPSVKVLTTPYPTIPPVTDFFMQVADDRFYPDVVTIRKGHLVTILNIATSGITINPSSGSTEYDFGRIESGEEKAINFDKAGVYRYTRSGKADQTLTITVTE